MSIERKVSNGWTSLEIVQCIAKYKTKQGLNRIPSLNENISQRSIGFLDRFKLQHRVLQRSTTVDCTDYVNYSCSFPIHKLKSFRGYLFNCT